MVTLNHMENTTFLLILLFTACFKCTIDLLLGELILYVQAIKPYLINVMNKAQLIQQHNMCIDISYIISYVAYSNGDAKYIKMVYFFLMSC